MLKNLLARLPPEDRMNEIELKAFIEEIRISSSAATTSAHNGNDGYGRNLTAEELMWVINGMSVYERSKPIRYEPPIGSLS